MLGARPDLRRYRIPVGPVLSLRPELLFSLRGGRTPPEDYRKAIEQFDMLQPGERVLVAVSGGKDSLALWDLLRELGYDANIDADRPFVEVSGRKGLGVKADDLIDRWSFRPVQIVDAGVRKPLDLQIHVPVESMVEPEQSDAPALDQAITFPFGSVSVIMVLLKVARMNAFPRGIFFRSRRRIRPAFLLAAPRRRSDIPDHRLHIINNKVTFTRIPSKIIDGTKPISTRRAPANYFLRPIARFGPRRVRAFVRVR